MPTAVILITLALVFYSIGVWAEHLKRNLRWSHVVFFALGLICDISGTYAMSQLAAAGAAEGRTGVSGALTTTMMITGTLALIIMAVHFLWAVIVMLRNQPRARQVFHKFSLVVWVFWLIPYITGAVGSMAS